MNSYRINKFLFHVSQDEQKAAQFRDGHPGFFDDYELTQEEREALQHCRVTKLYEAGVNPLLLMHLSLILKKDIRELYKQGI